MNSLPDLRVVPLLLLSATLSGVWHQQDSHTNASLRGLSLVSERDGWASGAHGTVLRTVDAGEHWTALAVPNAEQLDFRDIKALDKDTAWVLSIGEGPKSRIYKTADAGASWQLQFTNSDPKGFYDAIAFWDSKHGIALGDPVSGHFAILLTEDGGGHWKAQPGPKANLDEGAFAASGSCLLARGERDAWIVSGGKTGARVFHSTDRGRHWTSTQTPIRHDGPAAGIFSIAFSDDQFGIVVGGDYMHPADDGHNVAITNDGGSSWSEPAHAHPRGYRSAVTYVRRARTWITTGTSGSDVSHDDGETWQPLSDDDLNAVQSFGASVYATGSKGHIRKLDIGSLQSH